MDTWVLVGLILMVVLGYVPWWIAWIVFLLGLVGTLLIQSFLDGLADWGRKPTGFRGDEENWRK